MSVLQFIYKGNEYFIANQVLNEPGAIINVDVYTEIEKELAAAEKRVSRLEWALRQAKKEIEEAQFGEGCNSNLRYIMAGIEQALKEKP